MPKEDQILAVIPARSGSKRIPNKNIKDFLGKPLIYYPIAQALETSFIDRVIVDTDSQEIADIALEYGAEVPFLRPSSLAQDNSQVVDSIQHLLDRLEKEEDYKPECIVILQTTSPLREMDDIMKSWKLKKSSDATTVLTVCSTHPRLYHLNPKNDLILVNGSEDHSTNVQDWEPGYVLNGCFYIVDRVALLKEKRVITNKTKAIVCPRWRSVDLDTPEDWVLAELFYKNKEDIKNRIQYMDNIKPVEI